MPESQLAPQQLVAFLDQPSEAAPWLRALGVDDLAKAHANLIGLADAGLTVDLLAVVAEQLSVHLPGLADPDMALNNLQRFVAASRNPIALGSLFERDPDSLPVLLQILSTSQYLANGLIRDPEGFDLLRITEGQPVSRDVLVSEICSEVEALADEAAVMSALRRWKRRETLRIAYGDIIRNQPIETVAGQISHVADALCEAALQSAIQLTSATRGTPRLSDGRRCGFVVLALGKLGGAELNYSSDIDLMFLYEGSGKTDGPRRSSNQEYFERLARRFTQLLTESTSDGTTYRVDLRLRPEGESGPLVNTIDAALAYYDTRGRTWERQAFVKARPIAGDAALGETFLKHQEGWIYRRYLTRAEISGIKALKRRIERRAQTQQVDHLNVKTGHGGIRDIEFAIQFLQLLNGGDLPDIRTSNTLTAIMSLERDGCLTYQERSLLEDNYAFLRKLEHRLQVMFDLQTHTLPDDDQELRKLAIRMGYRDNAAGDRSKATSALGQFKADYEQRTSENRKILDHLLHDAFGDDPEAAPEVDLVLDPSPSEETIQCVLAPYGFNDIAGAYRDLTALSRENVRFLSTRRCRHFLASIASELLSAIAATPDPGGTLRKLTRVSESLGGKGTLWELFSTHPATLDLYVRLCAATSYLSDLLVSNPGMIDELMDSLMLDRLPSRKMLADILDDLSRGADDLGPILQSFKNSQHLAVGVRDILGKEEIQSTHHGLANIAEVILRKIARHEFDQLVQRFGTPTLGDPPEGASPSAKSAGEPCELIILALGKVGGREPNYHSDLDIVFLYEGDGQTRPARSRGKSTTNQHFFNELAQRISKAINRRGPQGRLYELDPRLRPAGAKGMLATSLAEFRHYHLEGAAELWERQALCKARCVYASPTTCQSVTDLVRHIIIQHPWQKGDANEIRQMRTRLDVDAGDNNLKRGPGGTVDIEFVAQMLQLKHTGQHPQLLTPGTLDALDELRAAEILDTEDANFFTTAYRFLRSVESRLRLMNSVARHGLPTDEGELHKLAWLLGFSTGAELFAKCQSTTREVRQRFIRIVRELS